MRSILSIACTLAVSLSGQALRTADGHSDLQGVWTNATITPMQRPSQWASKLTVTDAEAKTFEQAQANDLKQEDGASDGPLIAAAGSSGTGGYNALFIDRGSELARVDGQKRTALIIDPPDGKTPPQTQAAKDRFGALMKTMMGNYDNVKNRPTSERCLIGFGSTSGPLHAAGAVQQQLPDRADQGRRDDHGRDGARRSHRAHRLERTRRLRSATGWAIRSGTGKATHWSSTRPISWARTRSWDSVQRKCT